MNVAVLCVQGPQSALSFVVAALALQPDRTWQAGEAGRTGRPFSSSGFNITIAEVSDPAALVRAVKEFTRRCALAHFVFPSEVEAELSLGVTVGDLEQFTAWLNFSAKDLRVFGDLGLALGVNAYPTSDAANSEC